MQRILVIVAYIFFYADCLAQLTEPRGQYPFVQYTPKDGLVNGRVRKIFQDRQGRMYFITYGGLSVYDGTRFMNYTRQEGLAEDLVNDVLEIGSDSLLIATNAPSLNTLIRGKVSPFPISGNQHPIINRLLKSHDGEIYAAADDGLYVLSGNEFKRLPLLDKTGKDVGRYLDKIIEWENFLVIIPWDERIEKVILYDKSGNKATDTYATTAALSIEKDKQDNIWATIKGDVKILNKDSLREGHIRLMDPPAWKNNAINSPGSIIMCFDRENNIWMYTGKAIVKVSGNGTKDMISPEQELRTKSLLDVFEDREGIIWMATDGNGIIKLRGSNIRLINSFPPGYIFSASAIQQQQDTIWVYNTIDDCVLRVTSDQTKKFELPFKKSFPSIYLHDKKLYLVNDREILSIADKNNAASYLQPQPVATTHQDERFGCGIADPFGAIILLSTIKDSVYPVSVYRDGRLLSQIHLSFMTDKMVIDPLNRLWLATRDNHIMVFSLHPEQPDRYLQLEKDFIKEIPYLGIRTITLDETGNLWLGTRSNGVYKMELSGLKLVSLKQFTTQDGLTDNFIYSIACDNNNNILVGTQSGLDKIFRKSDRYVISNISKSNNFFQMIRQIAVTNNNAAWALTGEGNILKAEPSSIIDSMNAPPLLLTLLDVNNHPANDSVSHFAYRENNFTFNVAAPSFFDERSILYSYKLQGSNNENWSIPSHNPFFTLSNLSPGYYTLHTMAEFPDAIYSPQTASYSFIILPPWWQTWWFRILLISVIIISLILVTRSYYRRKLEKQKSFLEKQQAIEKERTRIATDMHDDLGAGLSRIKFLSETIGIKKQQQLPIEEDISKIREYSHEMIDKMGEIVWALNEKNDTLSDLLSYTRAYAAEYLSQNGIACEIKAPDVFPSDFVTGEFRRNIFLTVKEALHNVVKHSQASRVCISFAVDQSLQLIINDNGTGFNTDHVRPFSNGISNMKQRIKELYGNFEIDRDNGTSVRIDVPLNT